MAFGLTGRFFGQLALCLRQRIPMMQALDLIAADFPDREWSAAVLRIRDRIGGGAMLTAALEEFPPSFSRDLLPLVAAAENDGWLEQDSETLAAWPDAGATAVEPCLARVLAETSIRLRRGETMSEAFRAALRPTDSELLGPALDALARSFQGPDSPQQAMARFPGVFGPAVRAVIQQMSWNGTAETAYRELARALSRGWFGTSGLPQA